MSRSVQRSLVLQSPLLATIPNLVHGYTVRTRGNGAPFDLRLRPGREAQALANRASLCRELGVSPASLCFADQVHGKRVLAVQRLPRDARPVGCADALMTDVPGVTLAVQVADCLPVLLVDRCRPVVAAVHSGWRGSWQNIAGETVAQLQRTYGTRPAELTAWLAPAISLPVFEVGDTVAAWFAQRYGSRFIDHAYARPHIDLKGLVREQLIQAGVPACQIDIAPQCTCSDPNLCSYRREGPGTPHALAVLHRPPR